MLQRTAVLARLGPLRPGLLQTLLEAALGDSVFLLAAWGSGSLRNPIDDALVVVFTLLSLLWLAAWPAWRLRPIKTGGRWMRSAAGVVRAVLAGFLLALVGWLLARLLSPPAFDLLGHGATVVVIPGFFALRLTMLIGSAVSGMVQRRLRWQLMASHVGVIVVLVITLTSIGSLIGFVLLLRGIAPSPTVMAVSAADELRIAGAVAPLNRPRADRVLNEIETGRLPVRGEPPLAGLAPRPLLPNWIAVVNLDNRVLAAIQPRGEPAERRGGGPAAPWSVLSDTSKEPWHHLWQLALSGRAAAVSMPQPPDSSSRGDVLAEAPVRRPNGKIDAVVVLRVSDQAPTSRQSVQSFIALFGLSTVLLIVVISLPTLGLSFVFSYLMARGLTGRLEAVSYVARSIASGNLTQRAPVTSRNEVGGLAEDINRMADRLETTMGELQEARLQAERALRARQELVANVSHELRTPLAILRAHLETLLMRHPASVGPVLSSEEKEIPVPAITVRALQTETERLAALVDDLFALSRAEGGALEIRREPVDVAAIVDEIATAMRPLARQDGMVTLASTARPGLPSAMADPDRLRQIISNLVRNAVRHTPEGGIVVLAVAADGPWISVSVADTGEGIPPEHLPHVFERFYRVDEARSRASGSAGLGLAIVREFVELMGGRVEVESEPGEGTCFRVFLPAVTTGS